MKKEILIDLYKVKDLYSGLGQFSMNFARELIQQSPVDFQFVFLTPAKTDIDLNTGFSLTQANLQKRYLPMLNQPYDIWHSLQQFPSYFPNKRSIFILTIHDLNFLYEKNELKKKRYLRKLQKNCDRADYITTISDFVRLTIEKHINLRGKSVRTIYNGIAFDEHLQGTKPAFMSDKKFFFSIGVFTPKKNFHALISMMKHFPDHLLVIAGNNDTSYGRQILRQIEEANLSEKIILPGKITDSDRHWLYGNCEAFLFPSLAEGFGMPAIEAMKHGKPVFLSTFTSLPEIGGDVAFYFDNFDDNEMASTIHSRLNYFRENQLSLSQQIKNHAQKFSWETCTAQYVELYREIAGKI